jgi:hypothetical protein
LSENFGVKLIKIWQIIEDENGIEREKFFDMNGCMFGG